MSVSVIIPCYNSREFVVAAVESVLAQTVPVLEVIVVDDGSTDDPAAVLAAVNDPRLQIIHSRNQGVARARNLGCKNSSGDVLAFLDADDTWYPPKLERQLAVFAREPELTAVGTRMHHVGSRGTPIGITGEADLDDERQQLVRAGELMPFTLSSMLIPRPVFEALGGFDETVPLAEDLDMASRLAGRGRIATVTEPMGTYRMYAGSASAGRYRLQRQGARFVSARVAVRNSGGELTWNEFVVDDNAESRRHWLDDTARSLYRSAGVLAADRHYVGAVWRLGVSIVLRPSYGLGRLRQQQVFQQLRRGTRPEGAA